MDGREAVSGKAAQMHTTLRREVENKNKKEKKERERGRTIGEEMNGK